MDLNDKVTLVCQKKKVQVTSVFLNDITYLKCLVRDGKKKIEFSDDLECFFMFLTSNIYDIDSDARFLYSECLAVRKFGIEFGIVPGSLLHGKMTSYIHHVVFRYCSTNEAFSIIQLTFGKLADTSYKRQMAIKDLLLYLLLPFVGDTIDIRDNELIRNMYDSDEKTKILIDDIYDKKNDMNLFVKMT